jgi:hypothetical protein
VGLRVLSPASVDHFVSLASYRDAESARQGLKVLEQAGREQSFLSSAELSALFASPILHLRGLRHGLFLPLGTQTGVSVE